jgi:hypothetical protein
MTDAIHCTKKTERHSPSPVHHRKMKGLHVKSDITCRLVALARFSSAEPALNPKRRVRLARLRECANLEWVPWTSNDPAEPLFPSDESVCAAADTARTAYSIMHLTKDQLVEIHRKEVFDGFDETLANFANTAEMLKAVVQMIEGARGRMIVSACAYLQNDNVRNRTIPTNTIATKTQITSDRFGRQPHRHSNIQSNGESRRHQTTRRKSCRKGTSKNSE